MRARRSTWRRREALDITFNEDDLTVVTFTWIISIRVPGKNLCRLRRSRRT